MLSAEGRCKTLDAAADGYVRCWPQAGRLGGERAAGQHGRGPDLASRAASKTVDAAAGIYVRCGPPGDGMPHFWGCTAGHLVRQVTRAGHQEELQVPGAHLGRGAPQGVQPGPGRSHRLSQPTPTLHSWPAGQSATTVAGDRAGAQAQPGASLSASPVSSHAHGRLNRGPVVQRCRDAGCVEMAQGCWGQGQITFTPWAPSAQLSSGTSRLACLPRCAFCHHIRARHVADCTTGPPTGPRRALCCAWTRAQRAPGGRRS